MLQAETETELLRQDIKKKKLSLRAVKDVKGVTAGLLGVFILGIFQVPTGQKPERPDLYSALILE